MSRQSTVQYESIPSSPPPPPTQKVFNPSATVSAATQLPDATQRDRWGWIRRHPVPITFSIAVFLVLLIIVIMLLTLNSDVQPLYEQMPYNSTGVAIMGHNYLLDLDKRTLSIQWAVIGCGEHKLSTYRKSSHIAGSETCGPFDRKIDVYLNDATKPAFSFDPDLLPMSSTRGSLYIQSIVKFGIEHQVGVYAANIYFPATKERHLFDQQLAAPFDTYVLDALVFVIDTATNRSVPIIKFAAADPLNNFVTRSTDSPTTSKFTYDSGEGPVTIEVESRVLELDIRRSVLSRAFTMCLWIVNWALTAATLYITLVIFVDTKRMSDGVLALPITVVLTIPVIRGLYVGAPPFGILLDVVGFFLQIILVALCSLALLYLGINPSPRKGLK